MNDNEATNESSGNERSRKFKLTYERVVIECEDNCRVFDADHATEPDAHHGGFEPSVQIDADLIGVMNDVEEDKGERKRTAEYWPLPGTDCFVKICASPEGLGELEPSDTTTAYAVAKSLQILRMLLHRMQRPNGEPVTLKAVDIPSAA